MKIVFVVGNSRSGTTLMGRVLGNHPSIYTFGELHFFEGQLKIDRQSTASPSLAHDECLEMLERLMVKMREGFWAPYEPGRYRSDAEAIVKIVQAPDPVRCYGKLLQVETERHGKSIPCEQTPRYVYYLEEILSVFPDARVINMVRDPRDVMLSQKNKWKVKFLGIKSVPLFEVIRSWINYHPYTISKLWVGSINAANKVKSDPRVKTVFFEDILNRPRNVVESVCVFLQIPFREGLLDVSQVGSSMTKSNSARFGIDKTRAAGWRKGGLSSVELDICQRVAGEKMRSLGYKLEPVSVFAPLRWLQIPIVAIKLGFSLMLNIRRTKNMKETILRRLGF